MVTRTKAVDCKLVYAYEQEMVTAEDYDAAIAALRKLSNEVRGSLYMEEREMRALIGNTNFQCIERRLDEAASLLGSQSAATP